MIKRAAKIEKLIQDIESSKQMTLQAVKVIEKASEASILGLRTALDSMDLDLERFKTEKDTNTLMKDKVKKEVLD